MSADLAEQAGAYLFLPDEAVAPIPVAGTVLAASIYCDPVQGLMQSTHGAAYAVLGGGAVTLQAAYNGGAGVNLAAGTPISLVVSGVTSDALQLTQNDGTSNASRGLYVLRNADPAGASNWTGTLASLVNAPATTNASISGTPGILSISHVPSIDGGVLTDNTVGAFIQMNPITASPVTGVSIDLNNLSTGPALLINHLGTTVGIAGDPQIALAITGSTRSAGFDLYDGSTLPLGPATAARIRYNGGALQVSLAGAAYVNFDVSTPDTLQSAYASGPGIVVTAGLGPVTIANAAAVSAPLLALSELDRATNANLPFSIVRNPDPNNLTARTGSLLSVSNTPSTTNASSESMSGIVYVLHQPAAGAGAVTDTTTGLLVEMMPKASVLSSVIGQTIRMGASVDSFSSALTTIWNSPAGTGGIPSNGIVSVYTNAVISSAALTFLAIGSRTANLTISGNVKGIDIDLLTNTLHGISAVSGISIVLGNSSHVSTRGISVASTQTGTGSAGISVSMTGSGTVIGQLIEMAPLGIVAAIGQQITMNALCTGSAIAITQAGSGSGISVTSTAAAGVLAPVLLVGGNPSTVLKPVGVASGKIGTVTVQNKARYGSAWVNIVRNKSAVAGSLWFLGWDETNFAGAVAASLLDAQTHMVTLDGVTNVDAATNNVEVVNLRIMTPVTTNAATATINISTGASAGYGTYLLSSSIVPTSFVHFASSSTGEIVATNANTGSFFYANAAWNFNGVAQTFTRAGASGASLGRFDNLWTGTAGTVNDSTWCLSVNNAPTAMGATMILSGRLLSLVHQPINPITSDTTAGIWCDINGNGATTGITVAMGANTSSSGYAGKFLWTSAAGTVSGVGIINVIGNAVLGAQITGIQCDLSLITPGANPIIGIRIIVPATTAVSAIREAALAIDSRATLARVIDCYARNTSGTIAFIRYGAGVTLATASTIGLDIDLLTSSTPGALGVTALRLQTPATTKASTAGEGALVISSAATLARVIDCSVKNTSGTIAIIRYNAATTLATATTIGLDIDLLTSSTPGALGVTALRLQTPATTRASTAGEGALAIVSNATLARVIDCAVKNTSGTIAIVRYNAATTLATATTIGLDIDLLTSSTPGAFGVTALRLQTPATTKADTPLEGALVIDSRASRAKVVDIVIKNTSGTPVNIRYGSSAVWTAAVTALSINLNDFVNCGNFSATGVSVLIPTANSTGVVSHSSFSSERSAAIGNGTNFIGKHITVVNAPVWAPALFDTATENSVLFFGMHAPVGAAAGLTDTTTGLVLYLLPSVLAAVRGVYVQMGVSCSSLATAASFDWQGTAGTTAGVVNLKVGAATVFTGPIMGINCDLSTNVTAGANAVTGLMITIPTTTSASDGVYVLSDQTTGRGIFFSGTSATPGTVSALYGVRSVFTGAVVATSTPVTYAGSFDHTCTYSNVAATFTVSQQGSLVRAVSNYILVNGTLNDGSISVLIENTPTRIAGSLNLSGNLLRINHAPIGTTAADATVGAYVLMTPTAAFPVMGLAVDLSANCTSWGVRISHAGGTASTGTAALRVEGAGSKAGGISFGNSVLQSVGVVSEGVLRYNGTTEKFQVSLGGAAFVDLSTGAAAVSLDGAYTTGNTITQTTAKGSVQITSTSTLGTVFAMNSIASHTGTWTGLLMDYSAFGDFVPADQIAKVLHINSAYHNRNASSASLWIDSTQALGFGIYVGMTSWQPGGNILGGVRVDMLSYGDNSDAFLALNGPAINVCNHFRSYHGGPGPNFISFKSEYTGVGGGFDTLTQTGCYVTIAQCAGGYNAVNLKGLWVISSPTSATFGCVTYNGYGTYVDHTPGAGVGNLQNDNFIAHYWTINPTMAGTVTRPVKGILGVMGTNCASTACAARFDWNSAAGTNGATDNAIVNITTNAAISSAVLTFLSISSRTANLTTSGQTKGVYVDLSTNVDGNVGDRIAYDAVMGASTNAATTLYKGASTQTDGFGLDLSLSGVGVTTGVRITMGASCTNYAQQIVHNGSVAGATSFSMRFEGNSKSVGLSFGDGKDCSVVNAGSGGLMYDAVAKVFKVSLDGGAWTALSTGGGGGTLETAYNFGGAGAGRTINAISNAVVVTSSAADNNNILTLTKNPAGAQTGTVLEVNGTPGASAAMIGQTIKMGANTSVTGQASKILWQSLAGSSAGISSIALDVGGTGLASAKLLDLGATATGTYRIGAFTLTGLNVNLASNIDATSDNATVIGAYFTIPRTTAVTTRGWVVSSVQEGGAGGEITMTPANATTTILGLAISLVGANAQGPCLQLANGGTNANHLIFTSAVDGTGSHLYGPTSAPLVFKAGQPGGSANGRAITLTASNGSTDGNGGDVVFTTGALASTGRRGYVAVNGALAETDVASVTFNAGGTTTIPCGDGNSFSITATGSTTWVFSKPMDSGYVYSFTLILKDGATGGAVQTWPGVTKWPSGVAPTLTASGYDVLVFFTTNNGTTWRGVLAQADSK